VLLFVKSDYSLLGYDAVSTVTWLLTILRNLLTPSSQHFKNRK